VLMATGLIVGESLMGVVYAGLVAAAERAGSEDAAGVLAVVHEYPLAAPFGILLFSAAIAFLYLSTKRKAAEPSAA
jgi:hypothetical protein